MQIEDLVGQARRCVKQDRNQRGMTSIGFVLLNLTGGGLSALAGELQQTISMDAVANVRG
ncbi:hypothetical protein [Burkholderia stagnalis]